MSNQTKVIGVILAGGRGSRMQGQDKGLLDYHGQPLISYALAALSQVVPQLIINANRNQDQYRQFGFPVLADENSHFDGPLAGLLAVMKQTDAETLLVMPCDSPLIKPGHLAELLSALDQQQADAAVASLFGKIQPVLVALKTHLKTDLQNYLDSGSRKVADWLQQQNHVAVDFSDHAEAFININTPADL